MSSHISTITYTIQDFETQRNFDEYCSTNGGPFGEGREPTISNVNMTIPGLGSVQFIASFEHGEGTTDEGHTYYDPKVTLTLNTDRHLTPEEKTYINENSPNGYTYNYVCTDHDLQGEAYFVWDDTEFSDGLP